MSEHQGSERKPRFTAERHREIGERYRVKPR
jgi:hypothetical protein